MNRETIMWRLRRIQASVQATVESGLTALAARVGQLENYWGYLESKYKHVTVPSTNEQSETVYTETLYDAEGQVVGTCVSTIGADGVYTQAFTVGSGPTRILTSTKDGSGTWTEEWS